MCTVHIFHIFLSFEQLYPFGVGIVYIGAGTGGGVLGAACPHNSGAVGAVPQKLFIGLGIVGALVLPK